MSSCIQSSQVKLYWLNTLRNVPCSPPQANLPSQPCVAAPESLVHWLVQHSSGFHMHKTQISQVICGRQPSHKSFQLFLSQIKNHWRINSTWGTVKEEFKIKIQVILRNLLFTLFLPILNCSSMIEGRNMRLEREGINAVQHNGLGGKS